LFPCFHKLACLPYFIGKVHPSLLDRHSLASVRTRRFGARSGRATSKAHFRLIVFCGMYRWVVVAAWYCSRSRFGLFRMASDI
jgi:hypothetical protein